LLTDPIAAVNFLEHNLDDVLLGWGHLHALSRPAESPVKQFATCRDAVIDPLNYRLEKRASAGRWSHFCEAIACAQGEHRRGQSGIRDGGSLP